jgi:hypothetical protein
LEESDQVLLAVVSALQENSTATIKLCVGNQSGYGNVHCAKLEVDRLSDLIDMVHDANTTPKAKKMRKDKKPASRIKLQQQYYRHNIECFCGSKHL